MPVRILAISSLISAIGTLLLHLRHMGCPRRIPFVEANEGRRPSAIANQTNVHGVAIPSSGDVLDCSQLLFDKVKVRGHFDNFAGETLSHKMEAIWSDLILQAPRHSVILDVGNLDDRASLPISSILISDNDLFVHSFKSERTRLLEICETLSQFDGTDRASHVQVHPIAVAEREGMDLSSRQPQTSLDIFSSDQGWFGSNDDAHSQTTRTLLRGSAVAELRAPIVQVLSLHSPCGSSTHRVFQGAKELLNRHFVRNILVTTPTDNGELEEIESNLGMKILVDAGYHVHNIMDSSDAGHHRIFWWTL
jgi:hypothetical protein